MMQIAHEQLASVGLESQNGLQAAQFGLAVAPISPQMFIFGIAGKVGVLIF